MFYNVSRIIETYQRKRLFCDSQVRPAAFLDISSFAGTFSMFSHNTYILKN